MTPLSTRPIILASASPRRRQLLELIGLPFDVVAAEIDETPENGEDPNQFAVRVARDKALEVAREHPDRLVLGADTVVEIDSEILGKPSSMEHAKTMLRRLSSRTHLVHTAIAAVVSDTCHEALDTATVEFVQLADKMIDWYVATGEPMDKAGAYAIQGIGGLLVAHVEGSPHTVVGLPLHLLPGLFAAHELDFWSGLTRP
jgi:septum formation protein